MNLSRLMVPVAALISLFHFWANTFGTLPTLWLNSIHVGLMGMLGCLLMVRSGGPPMVGKLWITMALLFLGTGFYLPFAEEALRVRGEVMSVPDLLVSGIMTFGVLWLCFRQSGVTAPALAVLAIFYVWMAGRYLDGVFHFPGLGMERMLYRYYFTGEGLFGLPTTIAATYVFMFLLFSAFLLRSGAADTISRLAAWLGKRFPGGAAYAAVGASAVTGTISGSAVANTVSTGAITIPIMKKSGFTSTRAAAIETAASTGGQLMPPIMGAGAFLMAQYSGIPYATIITAAFLPALLYFAGVVFFVHFEARKLTQVVDAPRPTTETKAPASLWGGLAVLSISIFAITTLLLVGFTPTYAAAGGIVTVLLTSWIIPGQQMGWRAIVEALAQGARWMVPTTLLLACTGLVVGTLTMTGLSTAVSQLVLSWSGGYLPLALLLLATLSLVVGMGLPVTASYIVLAVVAVPALQELGVALLAAHLIVFWLSQDSNITPPVCLAAFAAAGIAKSPPMRTGFAAWRAAKALYVVVILFAYSGLVDGTWGERFWVAAFGLAGIYALTACLAVEGRTALGYLQRLGLAGLSVGLLVPSAMANVFAIVALGCWMCFERMGRRKS